MNINNDKKSTDVQTPVRRSRKETVKTITIIFLLIMLLLTFFSNTIMNHSLAEVSVTRLSRETIRRSNPVDLIIEANSTYSVSFDEAREIKRVSVKKGQEVKEGQVVFLLKEASESEAVKALQDDIDASKLEYEKALLKKAPDYFDLNAAIQSARDDLNDAVAQRNNASSEISRPSSPDNSGEIAELSGMKKNLSADLKSIEEGRYSDLSSDRNSGISDLSDKYNKAQADYEKTKAELTALGEDRSSELTQMNRDLETLKTALARLKEDGKNQREIDDKETEIRYLEEDIAAIVTQSTDISQKKTDLDAKSAVLQSAKTSFDSALSKLTYEISSELDDVTNKLEALQSSGGMSDMPEGSDVDYDALVRQKKYAYDAAVHSLEERMAEDRILDSSADLDLAASKKKIEEKEKKLEEMLSKQSASEITSPVDGIVEDIRIAPGQAFEANEELLVLNISDEGFTASYSANSESVKRVSKGQTFKLYESSDDISVVVSDMKKDKNDTKKTVIKFSLSGSDAVAGKNIKVDIGDEPVQMDNVVPKNAVKEDSKGKFVYAVRSKSSPLGNRYIVQRIDVTVNASDDTKMSVSGEFGDSADYIITASSKPFSSGDQVRLSGE